MSGFGEQEVVGVLRQIIQFHSVDNTQLAKGVEGIVVFPGIFPRTSWLGKATGGKPVNDQGAGLPEVCQ